MVGRTYEDFEVGDVIESTETYEMTPERIGEYASEFDPQPIHLDPEAATDGFFGGIIASGWHTLSATMRLMVRANLFAGAPVIGVGVDKLRYLAPVRPGDLLTARAEVIELRPSEKSADRGYVRLRVTTTRVQDRADLITQEWTVLVPRHGAEISLRQGGGNTSSSA